MPVIYAAAGNCHVYVDAAADVAMAQRIAYNAKVQRPGVCNAAETLLVHSDVAADVLPGLMDKLREAGVELRVDARTRALAAPDGDGLVDATEEDWDTEYLGMTMAMQGRRQPRGGDRPHQPPRHRTFGGDRDRRTTRAAQAFTSTRGRGLRVRERLDAVHRRRRVRHGRRDGQLDPEAARARPDRAA